MVTILEYMSEKSYRDSPSTNPIKMSRESYMKSWSYSNEAVIKCKNTLTLVVDMEHNLNVA